MVEVVGHLVACEAQQRAHHMSVPHLHSRESVDACSAYEVEQQCLHRIVLMVGHSNHVEVECLAQALKLLVAQLACCHLHRHLVLGGIGHRVEVHHLARHAQRVAQLGDEALVAVALLSS